jgi:deoxyhypusine monooxygenase
VAAERQASCITSVRCVQDGAEAAMVRHEAAEALGAIAEPHCIQLLKEFQGDQEPIVADSCVVRAPLLLLYLGCERERR